MIFMYRLTTPTNRFIFPIDPQTCEIIRITYAQNDKVLLTKEKPDLSIKDNTVTVTLTQEETKIFSARSPVQVQVRALTFEGKALASPTFTREVGEVLDDGILGN